MSDDDEENGFWYWMVISKPANYWIAKSLGGKAEEDADRVMNDLAESAPVALVILIIFIVAILIVSSFGVGG